MTVPVPVPAVGDPATALWADTVANDINNFFQPIYVFKSANTSIASSTALTPDPHLIVPMVANAMYDMYGLLDYEADVTGDMKYQFTLPAGATMNFAWVGYSGGDAATFNGTNTSATVNTIGGGGAGAGRSNTLMGSIVMSSTAGNLGLNWAQAVSSATATILHKYSYIKLTRVS
jgi:hypothetical protein